jgi:hypothetical protein
MVLIWDRQKVKLMVDGFISDDKGDQWRMANGEWRMEWRVPVESLMTAVKFDFPGKFNGVSVKLLESNC